MKGKLMKMFKIIFLLLCGLSTPLLHSKCNQPRRSHVHKNVVRCAYVQEDIYRGYSNNPKRYGALERHKRCFYCGCHIDQHTKAEIINKK